jgi:hypothetical protein
MKMKTHKNKMTKLFGTIAIGGGLLAASLISSAAHAACDMKTDPSGRYIPSEMLGKSRGSMVLTTLTKKGCTLEMKSVNVDTIHEYNGGKFVTKNVRSSGGVWKFDLTGSKKAVIPHEYVKANAIDETTVKMTKSLEVFTTLNADDSITLKVLFDVERAGAVVRMAVETKLHFTAGNYSAGESKDLFSGVMNTMKGDTKISVIPSKGLADSAAARNLVIAHGANWLFEAFQEEIESILGMYRLSYYRK